VFEEKFITSLQMPPSGVPDPTSAYLIRPQNRTFLTLMSHLFLDLFHFGFLTKTKTTMQYITSQFETRVFMHGLTKHSEDNVT